MSLLSFLFAPKLPKLTEHKEYVSPRIETFIPALLQAETKNRMCYNSGKIVMSDAGAIGRWQVMPDCLGYYNKKKNQNYKVKQLSDERINEKVGRWYLQYCYTISGNNIVLAINRYHQGHNSDKHWLYKSYLLDICPAEFKAYMVGKRVIEVKKVGKREWVRWE